MKLFPTVHFNIYKSLQLLHNPKHIPYKKFGVGKFGKLKQFGEGMV